MTPSNTLSFSDASRLALKVIESPLVIDYLAETNGVPHFLVAQVPNDQDWWDTVDKPSYCGILAERHRLVSYDKLMAEPKLKWPDLSTFRGPHILSWAFGDILRRPPIETPRKGTRNEIYEIKPDNKRGREKAQEKLRDVELSYSRHRLSGIYRRGDVYPLANSKRIRLQSRLRDVYEYLVNLYLQPLGARVSDIYLTVRRPEPGVLLYKICVDLSGLDNASHESVWIVANFAVRILSELNTLGQPDKVRIAATQLMLEAEPIDSGPSPRQLPWILAGKDFRTTPYLAIRPGNVADEIMPQLDGIRAGMYSRLQGSPGERYFICGDESWYLVNVRLPGLLRMHRIARLAGTSDLTRSTHDRSLLGLAPTVLITAGDVALRIPEWAAAVGRWVQENPGKTLLILAATVVVTALIILSAGTAAPVAAGAADVGVIATGTVAAGETGAMVAPIMASAAGPEIAGISAVPLATGGAGGAATAGVTTGAGGTAAGATSSTAMLNLLRTMAGQVTATELRQAAGQQVVDNLLVRAVTSQAAQQAVRNGARVAAKAGVGAGITLIAVAPANAYAYEGPTNGKISASLLHDSDSANLGTGRLYLVRVPRVPRYPNTGVPALYHEFDVDSHAEQLQAPESRLGKLRMLGWFDVI